MDFGRCVLAAHNLPRIAIEPAAAEVQLLLFALANHYQGAPSHVSFTIGIDANVWFEQYQQQMWYHAHPQSGQNPALRTFLFCLARLTCLPIHFIFCYDGNKCPTTKCYKQVKRNIHWMTRPIQCILDAFHILWLVAPAEAEAQLVHINKTAIVDAVMMNDSDVFVFGAHTVLRNSSLMDGNSIKIYTTDAIRQRVIPYLHNEAFAVMALCCGGDYDEGLHGCGITTALGLVQCGVGDQLREVLTGAHSMPPESHVFNEWRQDLQCHLAHDLTKSIGRLRPTVAASVSDSFPPPNVVKLYLELVITASVDVPYADVPHPPDLPALAFLVWELLGWEDSVKMLLRFLIKDIASHHPEGGSNGPLED
ncbi:PIN domain-like protein [Boletus coccyginus]|nr:PIN domain-like protein [Boletus coccyginus]